jgi:prefoldin subunit 5
MSAQLDQMAKVLADARPEIDELKAEAAAVQRDLNELKAWIEKIRRLQLALAGRP